ncbi:MAG TPA: hypothetical protein VK896_05885, partial [Gaiellaceae bacterium]|nr:hypothetical protein [Gaiellaceae bacterium]
MDGNSLGRLPLRARERIGALVDEWGVELVRGWNRWIDLPTAVGDLIGRELLGARPGETLVCDSVTVNLYKLAGAALAARPGRRVVVTDRTNFPTDRYVLAGLEAELRLFDPDPVAGPSAEDVAAACTPGDVGLVALSHVAYRSGALADLAAITAAAHDAGSL